MANSSFKLIDAVPNQILRWMGNSTPSFSDGRNVDLQTMQGVAAYAGSTLSGQALSGVGGAAKGIGGAIGGALNKDKSGGDGGGDGASPKPKASDRVKERLAERRNRGPNRPKS